MSNGIGSKRSNALIAALATFVVIAFAATTGASAGQYKLRTLYSFCAKSGCTDGYFPQAGLLADHLGNLFGTTSEGGDAGISGVGTVFELSPVGAKGWKHKILYSFCRLSDCKDGAQPFAKLIADTSGNLYGTTLQGGRNNGGVAFELMPNGKHARRKLKVLHDFHSCGSCSDGGALRAELTYSGASSGTPYDGVSSLYGTTQGGGIQGQGTVFALTPGEKWTETTLYNFCSQPGCADGGQPRAGLIVDAAGNLYGTTERGGGVGDFGTVFELSPNSGKTEWTETVLYSFCTLENCTDGDLPESALLMDGSGNIFGTASDGGPSFKGVVFKLVLDGASWKETIPYAFCSQADCADGRTPYANLIMDSSGSLFGTTEFGGGHDTDYVGQGGGTIFRLDKKQSVLHSFCAEAACADGEYPLAGLIMDGSGNFFGTTVGGGANGYYGTVFELSPK